MIIHIKYDTLMIKFNLNNINKHIRDFIITLQENHHEIEINFREKKY